MRQHDFTQTHSPPWAPHVVGEFTERGESGQIVKARCTGCGVEWGPYRCTSGRVKQHVASFAADHVGCVKEKRDG